MENKTSTLNKYNGLYAHIQVDVDCSTLLTDKILVEREGLNFFVRLEYEDLPDFYHLCATLCHNPNLCRKKEVHHDVSVEGIVHRRKLNLRVYRRRTFIGLQGA